MDKRALVIGINYDDTNRSLNGCVNDAVRVKNMLETRGFIVLLLTENSTHSNILSGIRWLLCDCSVKQFEKCNHDKSNITNNTLYYHFSGHGTRTTVYDNIDKNAIITKDNKYITSEDIHKYLIRLLPESSKLRGCIDCCNSRSNFDLKWDLVKRDKTYELQKTGNGRNSYCDAIIISGSSNYGNSYDTVINGVSTGVLTHYYLEYIDKHSKICIDKLLDYLYIKLAYYHQTPGISIGKQIPITADFWS